MFNENLHWFEKCHATAPPRTSILHNVTKKQPILSAASKEGGKGKVDSIAVSVFADIFIELTNTVFSIRRQDPNNYSDTETRCLV